MTFVRVKMKAPIEQAQNRWHSQSGVSVYVIEGYPEKQLW